MKKKILALAISLALVIGISPGLAFANSHYAIGKGYHECIIEF